MTDISGRHPELVSAIDRYGADLARWRDRALANRVRAAVLADRELRAYLDGAAALERSLGAARDALDADIRASGAIDRVAAAVTARRSAPSPRRAWWFAIAAAAVIAAGLGSVLDAGLIGYGDDTSQTVVALDPLVFETMDTSTQ
jgi:hypothetical protein